MQKESEKIERKLAIEFKPKESKYWKNYLFIEPPIFDHAYSTIHGARQIPMYKDYEFRLAETTIITFPPYP